MTWVDVLTEWCTEYVVMLLLSEVASPIVDSTPYPCSSLPCAGVSLHGSLPACYSLSRRPLALLPTPDAPASANASYHPSKARPGAASHPASHRHHHRHASLHSPQIAKTIRQVHCILDSMIEPIHLEFVQELPLEPELHPPDCA